MKNSIIAFVFVLVSNTFFAQSVFDKFDGQDNVASILVNKKMFQMMGSVKVDAKDKDAQQYLNLIKKLDNLKVFSTSNTKISADMKLVADEYWKTNSLMEMMLVDNSNKNLKIWTKSGTETNQIKELLVFEAGTGKENESVLMWLTGNFSLEELSVLINKMQIPGGDEITKATIGK